MAETLTGRCLCGGVTFEIEALNTHVDACHCGMCRRWAGGPYMTLQHEGPVAFGGTDLIAIYPSSDMIERGFCKRCGSVLFTRLKGQDHYFLSAGAIAQSNRLDFTVEIFFDDKPAYYAFANQTQKMTGAEVAAAWASKSAD